MQQHDLMCTASLEQAAGLAGALNLHHCMQRRGVTPDGQRASENAKAGSLQHFLCGLLAGTIAKLGTHPLDVCKKRFQASPWRQRMSLDWVQYGAAHVSVGDAKVPDSRALGVQLAGFQRSQRYGANVTSELVKTLPGCLSNIWHTEGESRLYTRQMSDMLPCMLCVHVQCGTSSCSVG